jgi:GNAT superfamily N-acetyltransferase
MERVADFAEPEPLSSGHDVMDFDSGRLELDVFLSQLAWSSQRDGFARTFVISDANKRVGGYYALCGGSIGRVDAPRAIARHGAPREVPVVLLARVAVDTPCQGRGLGTMLMHHAFSSSLSASEHVGFRAMMVHSLDDEARRFCAKFGFRSAGKAERTLLISMDDIARIIAVPSPAE